MNVTSDGQGSSAAKSLLRIVALENRSDQIGPAGEDLQRLVACGEAISALRHYCGPAANDLPPERVSTELNQAYRVFATARDSFSSEDFAVYFMAHLHQVLQNDGAQPGIKAGAENYLRDSVRRLSPDIAKLVVHVSTVPDERALTKFVHPRTVVAPNDQPRERLRFAVDNAAARALRPVNQAPAPQWTSEGMNGRPVAISGTNANAASLDTDRQATRDRRHARKRYVELEHGLRTARQLRGLKAAVMVLGVGMVLNFWLLLALWN